MSDDVGRYYQLSERIGQLEHNVSSIENKITPDQIAKLVDRSYFSINNLRLFLTILSIMLTIFVGVGAYFGYIGMSSILKIQEEAGKAESIRESTEEKYNSVVGIEATINNKAASITNTVESIEKTTSDKIAGLRRHIDTEFKNINNDFDDVRKELKYLSETFNRTALDNPDRLTARERQLLTLLAREIDPNNPVFAFNDAYYDFSFQRYDQAIEKFDMVLSSAETTDKLKNQAKMLRERALASKANPPEINILPSPKSTIRIGPYSTIGLHANTLMALIQKGYLTVEEAQGVIDKSRN